MVTILAIELRHEKSCFTRGATAASEQALDVRFAPEADTHNAILSQGTTQHSCVAAGQTKRKDTVFWLRLVPLADPISRHEGDAAESQHSYQSAVVARIDDPATRLTERVEGRQENGPPRTMEREHLIGFALLASRSYRYSTPTVSDDVGSVAVTIGKRLASGKHSRLLRTLRQTA